MLTVVVPMSSYLKWAIARLSPMAGWRSITVCSHFNFPSAGAHAQTESAQVKIRVFISPSSLPKKHQPLITKLQSIRNFQGSPPASAIGAWHLVVLALGYRA